MSIGALIPPADKLVAVELERVCICMRLCKLQTEERMMQLQERLRTHGNGATSEALLHLSNQLYVMTSALRKLDNMLKVYKS